MKNKIRDVLRQLTFHRVFMIFVVKAICTYLFFSPLYRSLVWMNAAAIAIALDNRTITLWLVFGELIGTIIVVYGIVYHVATLIAPDRSIQLRK